MEQKQINLETRQQMLAYELIAHTNSSFFLTGRAGTGKTTFLRKVQSMVNKNFIIVAPTGAAAIQAGGDTIHSFFGLPLEVCVPGTYGRLNAVRISTLKHADAIIIDEVSMTRCDIIDAIDHTLRKYLRSRLPFAGKQMIFVGDMFQLPPVAIKEERQQLSDIYHADEFFFYRANVFKNFALPKIEFQKIYRQEDEQFINILDHVRMDNVTNEDLALLNARVYQPNEEDGLVITLTAVNETADDINQRHLDEIQANEFVYEGTITGKFDDKKFPTDRLLHLKVGAQVMFLRNDQWRRWFNGTLGKVTSLSDDTIEVTLDNGETYVVPTCTWESYSYEYDRAERKMKKEVIGTFTQYPIKLAWAITIHKSQGQTFDKMKLDLRRRTFASGQLYVALSRVRSLNGLFLSNEVLPYFIRTDRDILTFSSNYNDEAVIDSEIECGKAVFEALRKDDYDEAAYRYLSLIKEKTVSGAIRDARLLADRFFSTIVCDEHLFGSIESCPQPLSGHQKGDQAYLAALLSLYSGEYEQAIEYADSAIAGSDDERKVNMLFVKSRALAKLQRYAEADNINVMIGDLFDFSLPDLKSLFMIAMLNELHIGDPGVKMMCEIVAMRPKYDTALVAMRMLMKLHNIQLDDSEDSEIVTVFNSDMSDEDFAVQLKASRREAPKEVSELIREIANMKKHME